MLEEGKQAQTIPAAVYPPIEQGHVATWMSLDRQSSTWDMNHGPSNRVLVVDDNPAVRRLTATILKSRGYRVIEAASGDEGLERFAEHHGAFELILADVIMPNMTGTEMIRRILAVDPSVPVMLMTGCTLDTTVPEAVPVLSKPFTPGALLKALDACLYCHRGALTAV